jgi:hypothetical protein
MHRFSWLALGLSLLSLEFSISSAAQKVEASDSRYIAVVPGYSGPESDITGACLLDPDPANCPSPDANGSNGSANYMLIGTTLSLQLPDGRVALVNCQNRYSAKGTYINRRNCGMPMVPRVEAEFNGLIAKLTWAAGADGKKIETETYKVVAMLNKRTDTAQVTTADAPEPH